MTDFQTVIALFITVFLSVITWGYGEGSKLVYTAIVSVHIYVRAPLLFPSCVASL